MKNLSVDEIIFIKSIPLKQLDELRPDIIPVSHYNKCVIRKDKQIKELQQQIEKMKVEVIEYLKKQIEDLHGVFLKEIEG